MRLIKIDLLKLKYKLLVLVTPNCWVRLGTFDKKFDEWLWNSCKKISNFKADDGYCILLKNKLIWTKNYPYSSGHEYKKLLSTKNDKYCSRATALFLEAQRKKAQPYLILKGMDKEESKLVTLKALTGLTLK